MYAMKITNLKVVFFDVVTMLCVSFIYFYVWVRMYVCRHLRTYVCMYVCMYAGTYVCMYVCMYALQCNICVCDACNVINTLPSCIFQSVHNSIEMASRGNSISNELLF